MMNIGKDFKNICNWPTCAHTEVKDKPVLCALEYATCKTLHLGEGKRPWIKQRGFQMDTKGPYHGLTPAGS